MAPAAAAVAAFAGLTIGSLASADGGFFPSSWRWATIGLAATAAIVVLLRDRIVLGKGEVALLVGLAAFTGWIALSAVWADDRSQVVLETERAVVYVAGVLAAVLLVERRSVPYLLAGIAAAAALVSVYSVARGGSNDQLDGPIGYANALGILAVIGILIEIAAALQARRTWAGALAFAAVVPLASALVLSESRGSVVALAVGLAATVAVAPKRLRLPLGAMLIAAAAAAIGILAWAGGEAELEGGDRPHYWRVAREQFEENPVVGAGAGAFHDYWLEHRPDPALLYTPEVLDAHSLYLETLAELGIVGFAILAATLAVPLAAAARRRNDRLVAAAIPAYAAFLVHAGLDWDWEMPAVTLAGLFCGVAVLLAQLDDSARPAAAPTRAFLLASALGLVAVAFVRLV